MNTTIGPEQALLATMFCDLGHRDNDLSRVTEDLFFQDIEKSLYRKIMAMWKNNEKFDMIIARTEYGFNYEELIYIHDAWNAMGTNVGFDRYLECVQRKKVARQLMAETKDPTTIDLNKIEKVIENARKNDNNVDYLDTKQIMPQLIDHLQSRMSSETKRYKTGFDNLDRTLGDVFQGHFMVVGARSSMGKSSLMLKMAYNNALMGRKVLYYSAEMSSVQLIERLTSIISGIPIYKIREVDTYESELDNPMKKEIHGAWEKIYKLSLVFRESSIFNPSELDSYIDTSGCDMLVLDFIQRCQLNNPMNRAASFSDLANNLKALSIRKKIFIVAGSQLARPAESKNSKVTIDSLKESGGIGEAADSVLLIDLISRDEDKKTDLMWVKVEKNRTGDTGKVLFNMYRSCTNFYEHENQKLMDGI